MAKGTRICKVCGEPYEYCMTNRPTDVFRYQDVACSPEHGSIYFAQILESRGIKTDSESKEIKADDTDEVINEEVIPEEDIDDIDLYDEDDDDEEDEEDEDDEEDDDEEEYYEE